jgi:hypothetical protein
MQSLNPMMKPLNSLKSLNFTDEIPQLEDGILEFNDQIPQFDDEIPQFHDQLPQSGDEVLQFDDELPEFNDEIPLPQMRAAVATDIGTRGIQHADTSAWLLNECYLR